MLTDSSLMFDVAGLPMPQGSHDVRVIQGKNGERARGYAVHHNVKELDQWRNSVERAAVLALGQRSGFGAQSPVLVRITFWLPKPPTVKREFPSVPPDIDKLGRAVLDPLQKAGVLRNDGQVTDLYSRKRYGVHFRGATIEVRGMGMPNVVQSR